LSGDERKTLTERQIEDEGLTDWRVLFFMLHARFRTGDFDTGLKFLKKIGKAADKADHHPDVDLSYPQVDIRLQSHDVGGLTSRDVDLAREISGIAADLEIESAPEELSVVEIGLDTPAYDDVKEFWAAALGYEASKTYPEELTDPNGTRPTLWFQESDSAKGEVQQRFHLDIRVPPEVAESRVKAVLEAGGTLVTDEYAPTFWVLADKHGNKACITTWLGRDPGDEVKKGDAAGKIEAEQSDTEKSDTEKSDQEQADPEQADADA